MTVSRLWNPLRRPRLSLLPRRRTRRGAVTVALPGRTGTREPRPRLADPRALAAEADAMKARHAAERAALGIDPDPRLAALWND